MAKKTTTAGHRKIGTDVRVYGDVPADVCDKIDTAARAADRKRSPQVRFILKEWARRQEGGQAMTTTT
jgi:hypothetical protein